MIIDRLDNAGHYIGLSGRFRAALDFLTHTDLLNMPLGRHQIDGGDVYLLNQRMDLKDWNEGGWEAHRAYADIQLVLDGEELLGFCPEVGLPVEQPYCERDDVEFFKPDAQGIALPVKSGDFVIFFPGELHRPCIRRPNAPAEAFSRRAVVKVRI